MKVTIEHQHKCNKIASAPAMGEGRDWWIGKLIEPIKEYPEETHCLHLNTKLKSVTFLCNGADFRNLMILCRAVIGQPNENWMQSMLKISTYKPESNET